MPTAEVPTSVFIVFVGARDLHELAEIFSEQFLVVGCLIRAFHACTTVNALRWEVPFIPP